MAWLSGWDYRKEITVQHANVDSNLTDFPVYVKIDNDADFHEARSDGYDIRFTQSDGSTLLKYEREYWTGGNGSAATAHFFVKVPSILSASGATIYCYYGKSDATDGEDANNVWDSNFEAVWHLGESSGSAVDSTGSGHTGTFNGTLPNQVDGPVYKAQDFTYPTNSDYIDVGTSTDLQPSNLTISFWLYRDVTWNNIGDLFFFAGGNDTAWNQATGWYAGMYSSGGSHESYVCVASGNYFYDNTAPDTLWTINTWHHFGAVFNSTTNAYDILKDGSSLSPSASGTPDTISTNSDDKLIGKVGRSSALMRGRMAEVRVSSSVRADAWLKFEFKNIDESDQELTWGSEEGGGAALLKIINETIQLSEGILNPRTMLRIINETENLTENIVRLKSMVRVIDETEQITEASSKVLGFVRVINETVQVSEGIVRLTGLIRVIDETLQITEGIIRVRDLVRIINETANIQEGIIRARDLVRVIDETVQLQENPTRLKAMVRVIDETLNVTEEIIKTLSGIAPLVSLPEKTQEVLKKIMLKYRP